MDGAGPRCLLSLRVVEAAPGAAPDESRVGVRLHWLHPDVTTSALGDWSAGWAARWGWDEGATLQAVEAVSDRVARTRLPIVLRTMDDLADAQRDFEAWRAADAAAQGGRPRCLTALISPLALLDACTVQRCLLLAATGSVGEWDETCLATDAPCARCGSVTWGTTCTPPRFSGGGLRRDVLDDLVTFCWTCLARRRC